MNNGATAFGVRCFSCGEGSCSCFIFFNAEARPVGERTNFTPVASAVNSLRLETAKETNCAKIGARIAKRIPKIKRIAFALLFSLSLPENHKLLRKISAAIEINPTKTAVSVINLIS